NPNLETPFQSDKLTRKNQLRGLASKYGNLILFPAIFVLLTEFLRSVFIFNFTWGFLGYSLHNVLYLQQLAAFGGVYLLSFIVYFFNAAIFQLVFPNLAATPPSWGKVVKGAGIVAVLFLILNYIGFDYYNLTKEKISAVKEEKTVAVLQGNIKQSVILPGSELNIEKSYLDMIDEAAEKNADILVLPESVIPGNITFMSDGGDYFSEDAVILKEKIENFLKEKFSDGDKLAVFGAGVLKNEKNYNALVYADGGGIFGKYFKRYLVPFGEYRPAFLENFAPQSSFERTPGVAPMVVEKNGVKFGSLICQEAMYPNLWRDSVLAGANVLINAGNDGIFGSEKAAQMMGIMAKTRAIESGRYVVRAMKTGVSAVFEPTGDEIARAGFQESALLFAKIKPLNDLTIYIRLGDWILILSTAIVAVGSWRWYNENRK
ncbi:MAG: apolipoprotein N-acyltransferase, partial [Patescibacteria group bacterium]